MILLNSCKNRGGPELLPLHRLTTRQSPTCQGLTFGACIIEFKTINDLQNQDKLKFLEVINNKN